MTETAVQPVAAEVDQWLSRFEEALTAGDSRGRGRAVRATTSFWRDLVAFTWNIKTVEGPAGVKDMLEDTLAHVEAARLAHDRAADRGRRRHRRPGSRSRPRSAAATGTCGCATARRGRCSPTLDELKGHEEPTRPERPKGVEHGADPDRETWLESREREAAELGYATQPEVVIVGGGQGGIALGARLRQLGVPDDHRRAQRAPRRLVAQALQVALPARPGLVRPPAVHQVPRELAGVLAEGQDRRLARDVHAGDGAQLLELDDGQERDVRRGGRRVGRRRRARRRRDHAAAEAARAGDRHVRQAERARDPRAWTSSTATSTTPREHPGPGRLRGQAVRRDRLQQLRARHLRRAVGGRRRRDDGAALLDAHRALGHADGHRARRALLRGGGRRRRDDREGRHDLRLAAVPDPARVPDPALRRRCASATPTSTTGSRRPASSSTGARTAPACS